MRTTDLIFTALYIVAFLVCATQLFSLQEMSSSVVSAKLFPWGVIIIGIAMGLIEGLRTILAPEPENTPTFREIWQHAFTPRRMTLLGLFIAYLISIKIVGFLVATAVFCAGTILILSPQRNLSVAALAVAIAGGTLGLIYLLLVVYLEAFLP